MQNDEDKDDVAPPDEKNEPKDANDGVEMTNDFDGDLEDFKPPPEDEKKDEDEQEDEHRQGREKERRMRKRRMGMRSRMKLRGR